MKSLTVRQKGLVLGAWLVLFVFAAAETAFEAARDPSEVAAEAKKQVRYRTAAALGCAPPATRCRSFAGIYK